MNPSDFVENIFITASQTEYGNVVFPEDGFSCVDDVPCLLSSVTMRFKK